MSEVTQLLAAVRDDPRKGLDAVFDAVYPELKAMAIARSRLLRQGATLSATVLVHETYVKLIRARDLDLTGRRHFFACAGQAMRQIVVDDLRAKSAGKRDAEVRQIELGEDLPARVSGADWLDLQTAMEELEAVDPELREVVDLRVFAGLDREELAELLGCSVRTVNRRWRQARAFLYSRLGGAS